MTEQQDRILKYALNIARLKTAGAYVKEDKLVRVLDEDIPTYLEKFRTGLELAAERELLERGVLERSIGEQPT